MFMTSWDFQIEVLYFFFQVLDLSNNYLEKIDLNALVPKQLMYLDISGNSRLHVDSKQFYHYR